MTVETIKSNLLYENEKSGIKVSKDDMPELFYNYQLKRRFAYSNYKKDTSRIFMSLFRKSGKFEKKYNKDLYRFNLNELANVIESLNTKTKKSLQNSLSRIQKYIDFCDKIYNKKSTINVVAQFNNENNIEDLLKKDDVTVFNRNEILDMAMKLENPQDGVVIGLLFDGVSHNNEFEELINLTIDDLNEKEQILKLPNREISLSKETLILIKKAHKQIKYKSIKGDIRYHNISPGNHILRGLRGKSKLNAQLVSQKIIRISEYLGYEYLNGTTLSYSGQIHYSLVLMNKEGLSIEKVLPIVLKRFGMPINTSSEHYLKKRIEDYINELKVIKQK